MPPLQLGVPLLAVPMLVPVLVGVGLLLVVVFLWLVSKQNAQGERKQLPARDEQPTKREAKTEEKPKREAPRKEPETKPEPKKQTKPEPRPEPEAEAKPEPEPEPEPEAEEEPPAALPKPAPADFSGEDYPVYLDPEDRQLWKLANVMDFAQQWHETHDGHWEKLTPDIEAKAPEDLRQAAEKVGGVRFRPTWTHGWAFPPESLVTLFDKIELTDVGYLFGSIDDGESQLLYLPDGRIVQRVHGTDTDRAPDLENFLNELIDGFAVARRVISTEAIMGSEDLVVLPEEERDRQPEDSKAGFPRFWLGAKGPGIRDVGYDFDPPFIRHDRGSRVVDHVDISVIVAFLEWLDTNPEAPEGAMDLAKSGAEHGRPVGVVEMGGEVAAAWWGDKPPEEIDALLEHLRGLEYYG